MGLNFTELWPSLLALALLIYWIGVAIALITDDREPTATLAWLLVLWSFPIIGLVFYVLFGRNWKKRTERNPRTAQIAEAGAPTLARVRGRYAQEHEAGLELAASMGFGKLAQVIVRSDEATVLPAYDVEILVNGASKFAALKADLAAATDTINIQYFIWERDELTAEITEILLERLAAGVELRMLNDWAGNVLYKKDEIKKLRAAGADIRWDVTDLRLLNYRNHRKMVIIDATKGYTGGINVGQEYIDGKPKYPFWRDTHCRFNGPAVMELQKMFSARWLDVTDEDLFTERFFPAEYPESGRRTMTQIVSTGVDVRWDPARRAHMVAMAEADERLWIQSPYLVPTPDIYSVMIDTALSGVDVRFMMTGWPDKKIAWYAAESFFRPLVAAGVKIYRYNKGFFHAKTITIDGKISSIGTMNFDIRSLALHKELMAWFYDPGIAEQQERIFLDDMQECEEITLEMIDEWGPGQHLRNASCRLASNLL
jgi:cardiolipin synthase